MYEILQVKILFIVQSPFSLRNEERDAKKQKGERVGGKMKRKGARHEKVRTFKH
jgi:hypothetical protein